MMTPSDPLGSIPALLRRQAERFPNKVFLFFKEQEVTYHQLDERTERIAENLARFKIRPGEKVALFLPNMPEFLFAFFGALKLGAVVVPINTQLKGEEAAYILQNSESRVLITTPTLYAVIASKRSEVPTIYALLLHAGEAEEHDLSSLRFCICGAAPMPVELFQKFEEKFHAFILEGYGLSEGTCVSSINPLGGRRKIGSIGLPLPNQEMKIFNDQGQEVPAGQVGEIVIRGENVMAGYFKNRAATEEALRGGWFHTGDLGYRDEEGYFFIVGRKKEMIIRGGENIYPKEIEERLYRHPDVLEAAVIGLPDPVWGEAVAAFIIPKPGISSTAETILAYCREHLARFKCPKEVIFMESFPKTATGKIQKGKLREAYLQRGAK